MEITAVFVIRVWVVNSAAASVLQEKRYFGTVSAADDNGV